MGSKTDETVLNATDVGHSTHTASLLIGIKRFDPAKTGPKIRANGSVLRAKAPHTGQTGTSNARKSIEQAHADASAWKRRTTYGRSLAERKGHRENPRGGLARCTSAPDKGGPRL